MTKVFRDRVMETSTSTGTGNFTLAGAVAGYQTFAAAYTVGQEFDYTIVAADDSWEAGRGTYVSANTLERTEVYASSNSGSAVSFAAGSKQVLASVSATTVAALAAGGGGGGGGGPVLIDSHTAGVGETTVSFTGIPDTYRELLIQCRVGSTNTSGSVSDQLLMRLNGDSGARYDQITYGQYASGAAHAFTNSSTSLTVGWMNSVGAGLGPGYTEIRLPQYGQAHAIQAMLHESIGGQANVGILTQKGGGQWRPTSPDVVDQIEIFINGNAFNTGATFELYGIA